mgnify:CR=1 FL=1
MRLECLTVVIVVLHVFVGFSIIYPVSMLVYEVFGEEARHTGWFFSKSLSE